MSKKRKLKETEISEKEGIKEETEADKKSAESRDTLLKILSAVPEDIHTASDEEVASALEDINEEDFEKIYDSLNEKDRASVTEALSKVLKQTEAALEKQQSEYISASEKKRKMAVKEVEKMYKQLPMKSKTSGLKTSIQYFFNKLLKVLHLGSLIKHKVVVYAIYRGALDDIDMETDEPIYYTATHEEALLVVNKLMYYQNIIHYNLWCMYRNLEAGFLKPSWTQYFDIVLSKRTEEDRRNDPDCDYVYSVVRHTYYPEDIALVLRTVSSVTPTFIPTETYSEILSYLYREGFDEYSETFFIPEKLNSIYNQDPAVHDILQKALNYLNAQQKQYHDGLPTSDFNDFLQDMVTSQKKEDTAADADADEDEGTDASD